MSATLRVSAGDCGYPAGRSSLLAEPARSPHVAENYPADPRTYPQRGGGGQNYQPFEAETDAAPRCVHPRNYLGGGQGSKSAPIALTSAASVIF